MSSTWNNQRYNHSRCSIAPPIYTSGEQDTKKTPFSYSEFVSYAETLFQTHEYWLMCTRVNIIIRNVSLAESKLGEEWQSSKWSDGEKDKK